MERREALIMSMELRGFKMTEIAKVLEMSPATVANITSSQSYREELHRKLNEVDDEFLRMKPKALRALDNGLCSTDEGVGLRAAEMWFKGMGYRGFSRDGNGTEGAGRVTAEDIATQLLSRGGGSVTITASPSDGPILSLASQGQDDKSDRTD